MTVSQTDLFELKRAEEVNPLFESLLQQKTRSGTLKLLNELAGDFCGRDYLCTNAKLLSKLAELFISEQPDSENHQCLVGILQKMSLRPKVQKVIATQGVLQNTFKLLKELVSSISDYTLEYLLAMIINVSTNRFVRQLYEADTENELVETLMLYWDKCPTEIRQFLNGALYSLVSHPQVKKRCVESDLSERIAFENDKRAPAAQKQVEYILEKLASDSMDDTIISSTDSRDIDSLTLETVELLCKETLHKAERPNDVFRNYQLSVEDKRSAEQWKAVSDHFDEFFEQPHEQMTKFDITEVGVWKGGDDSVISNNFSHVTRPLTHLNLLNNQNSNFTYSPASELASHAKTAKSHLLPAQSAFQQPPPESSPPQAQELHEAFDSHPLLQRTPPIK